jgi:sarcosine oxidase gamma subunit
MHGLATEGLTTHGLSVALDTSMQVGALRYCEPGTLAAEVVRVLGSSLPIPGQVLLTSADEWLAWRSPTETLVLCGEDSQTLVRLSAALAGAPDACLVDQTGGIWILRVRGPRTTDLLLRLGATTAVPALGACRIGRLAEITVASLCVSDGEVLLLVERLYAEHLLAWIRETIADF